MSLYINADNVTAVLLPEVGWLPVDKLSSGRSSFDLDSYEFHRGNRSLLGGGTEKHVPATGFVFTSEGKQVYGPLTSVLAVKAEDDED